MGKFIVSFAVMLVVWDVMSSEPGDSVVIAKANELRDWVRSEYHAITQGESVLARIQSFLSGGVSNYNDQKIAGRLGPTENSIDLATIAQNMTRDIWSGISGWFGGGSTSALKLECRNALQEAATQPISGPANRTAERNRYRMLEAEMSAYFENASAEVKNAIKCASLLTDVNRNYLIETAFRESGFNPKAKARKSSAAGLYQFVDQTWYAMLHQRGGIYGLNGFSSAISKSTSGRYKASNTWQRRKVLNLRYNPKVNAIMAAELAIANENYLRRKLSRQPTMGELYAAHFLGVGSALKLINLNISAPTNKASSHFPKAARVNRRVFFTDNGEALTIAQFHSLLIGGEPAAKPDEPPPMANSNSASPVG